MLKDQFFKTSGLHFDKWLFGSEKFSGVSRNRPQVTYSKDVDGFLNGRHVAIFVTKIVF